MAFTLSDVPSQKLPLSVDFLPNSTIAVLQPHLCGLGSSPFARRYLGNLFWFLFPSYLDGSLHSVWLLCPIYSGIQVVINYRITPFGNPGVNGYVLLSPAYRSLSRPSSSYSSQASAINLYSLDHITIFAFFISNLVSKLPSSFALITRFIQAWWVRTRLKVSFLHLVNW